MGVKTRKTIPDISEIVSITEIHNDEVNYPTNCTKITKCIVVIKLIAFLMHGNAFNCLSFFFF